MERDSKYSFSRYDLEVIKNALEVYIDVLETANKIPVNTWNKGPLESPLNDARRIYGTASEELMSIEERIAQIQLEKASNGTNS